MARLAPVLLALLLLGAHFYRDGNLALVAATLALVATLAVRRPWAARLLQVALVAGAIEWLRTAAALIAVRHSLGMPYARLALILGAVALLTAACLLVFRSPRVRERFALDPAPEP